MQFPETWTSQTRPIDPDATSKRKRKSKSKAKATDGDCHPNVTDLEESSINVGKQSKRMCVEPVGGDMPVMREKAEQHAVDNTLSVMHRHVDPKTKSLDQQLKLVKPPAMDPIFNPVMVNVTTQPQVPIVLEIYSLISRLPYAQMLNQVFTDDASTSAVVPVVTRAYEESYMREVIHAHERPCICGESCECNFIDPLMPFVGVEFTMNDDTHGDSLQQMCVLCSRRLTQELFFNMVYNGHRFRGTIQRYGNLCNQPLEYAREAMLICPQNGLMQNMPLPMVAHQRHRYSVFSQNGTRYLRQHKVMFEDFRLPSSSTLSLQH